MWKYAPFTKFLADLVDCEDVHDIIIIDNNPAERPATLAVELFKVRILVYPNNIRVNPAWNLGVQNSHTNNICIANDDIVFDLKIFKHVRDYMNSPNMGVMGINPGLPQFDQIPLSTGTIDIRKYDIQQTFGFGCLMFVRKDNWIPIPDDLKVYYGDNWIFETALVLKRDIYFISDMLFITPYAQTTKLFTNSDKILAAEGQLYNMYIQEFRGDITEPYPGTDPRAVLEEEYNNACKTPTDINEHLPTLRALADECESVTELGTRNGQSTRAFLASDAYQITSLDLYIDPEVEKLFVLARKIDKNAVYCIANSLRDDVVEETDLLFIDTDHSYKQLSEELRLHGNKANKYIVLHDTHTYREALLPAVIEFMVKNGDWIMYSHDTHNNGLTVLKRA